MQTLALVDRCYFRQGAILFGNKKITIVDLSIVPKSARTSVWAIHLFQVLLEHN